MDIVCDILMFVLLYSFARALEKDKHFVFAFGAAVLIEVSKGILLLFICSPCIDIFDATHLGGQIQMLLNCLWKPRLIACLSMYKNQACTND